MTENYILLKTEQQLELESVLMDLANLYRDTPYAQGMQLFRKQNQADLFLICFTNSPDLMRFAYFVNYLVYPFDHSAFKPKVRGFFRTAEVVSPPALKDGTWLMFYINPNDEAGDNAYITNEAGEAFMLDFGRGVKQLEAPEEEYQDYKVNKEHYLHVLDIFPSSKTPSKDSKPWWKFW